MNGIEWNRLPFQIVPRGAVQLTSWLQYSVSVLSSCPDDSWMDTVKKVVALSATFMVFCITVALLTVKIFYREPIPFNQLVDSKVETDNSQCSAPNPGSAEAI